MSAKLTEKEKSALRIQMIQCGFRMLKSGGINTVNIDEITKQCFVSKGTFYNLFESKTEFLYQVMIFKRQESKDKIHDYLSDDGMLSYEGLRMYLHWLADENPNIFSYLDGQHTKWLVSKWPPDHLLSCLPEKRTEMAAFLQLSETDGMGIEQPPVSHRGRLPGTNRQAD